MKSDEYRLISTSPNSNVIFWDKDIAYKCTGYGHEPDKDGFRTFSLESLSGNYSYVQLTKDNYEHFEFILNGQMQAALHLAIEHFKKVMRNSF